MSTSRKNNNTKAPLENFTRDIKYRKIIVDPPSARSINAKTIGCIMKEVNKTIQEVSFEINNRQLPFVLCTIDTYKISTLPDSRIVLLPATNNYKTPFSKKERFSNSHCIEFQLSAFYNQITYSNSSCDAKLVIDENYLVPATTDLFLDLAMFNSYSFFKNCTIEEKRKFSQQKFEFFKERKLDCYYTYDNSDLLMYYSLAFSARKSAKSIDIPLYLTLWDEFLQTYYPDAVHEIPSLEVQLRNHVDYGQLPCKKILDTMNHLPSGSYLLVKLNRQPRSSKIATELLTLLGGSTLTLKNWKVIPISEYPKIKKYAQTLHLSVFKLVKK